jgi:methionine-rich copper-binding protein CopC
VAGWPRVFAVAKTLLGAAMVSLAAAMASASPAAAHTELLQASPGPGQQAGGTIDFIDLAFLQTVSDATIEVSHEGQPIPGTMVEPNGQIVRFGFAEPLSSPGRYDVTYRMISPDQDQIAETYWFTFEPAAPQAFRLGDLATRPTGGRSWTQIIATAVLIACLAALAFLYLSRVEARRRAAASDDATQER